MSHTQNIPKLILRLPGMYEWVHYGLWYTKWVLYASLSKSTFLSMHREAFYRTHGMRLRLVHNIPQKSFKRRSITWKALRTLKYSYKQQSCTKEINKNQFIYIVKGGVSSNPSTMSLAHHITTSNHTIDVKYKVHGYKIRIKEKESRENYLESLLFFFGSSSLSILLLAQRVEWWWIWKRDGIGVFGS